MHVIMYERERVCDEIELIELLKPKTLKR